MSKKDIRKIFRVTDKQDAKLKRLCKKYDKNESEMLRKLIDEAK